MIANVKLYDASKIDWEHMMFSKEQIRKLLIPLVIEQFLASFMGMADTMMVSRVGGAAISAVSLVDSINILIIQVFAALATGAAIICSQYIGHGDKKESNRAAQQVVLSVAVISCMIMIFSIVFCRPMLQVIFGQVEKDVMDASVIYMLITAASFPFIALFQAGSAFYRACENSKFPMKVSVISNVINIVGNAVLIFVFHMGVAGAAIATLVSRVFCMVVIFYALAKPKQAIVIRNYRSIRPDFSLIKKILMIGIPSGIENGMFQFGKLAIQSSVSTLGTVAIAAQAMTNTLENLNGIAAIGIGVGLMTIVGQCIGAGRQEEAKYYIVKLVGISEIVLIASCLLAFLLTKPVLYFSGMEPESARMCFEMMCAITIVKPIVWALSFIPPYGMRAAGDVKFLMISSCMTMWFARVVLAICLIRFCGFGPMAVWIGMFVDWTLRGIISVIRFRSGKWLQHQVI